MKIASIIVMIFMILVSVTQQKWGGWKKIGKFLENTGKNAVKAGITAGIASVFGNSDMTAEEKVDVLKDLFELYTSMEQEETN